MWSMKINMLHRMIWLYFLVLNANCIQLFPTTILSIRSMAGSVDHSGVMLGIIVTTFLTSIISIIICKLLQRVF